jgi:hypothetical protein
MPIHCTSASSLCCTSTKRLCIQIHNVSVGVIDLRTQCYKITHRSRTCTQIINNAVIAAWNTGQWSPTESLTEVWMTDIRSQNRHTRRLDRTGDQHAVVVNSVIRKSRSANWQIWIQAIKYNEWVRIVNGSRMDILVHIIAFMLLPAGSRRQWAASRPY